VTPRSQKVGSVGKFEYFEKDGAVFRKPATQRHPFVREIKVEGEWRPYTGDRIAPVVFGDQITAEEAGEDKA
jgi:hypothetical protein